MESHPKPTWMRSAGAFERPLVLALAVLLVQGCASFDASEHHARPHDACVLEGSLTTSIDRQGTWIVAALEHSADRTLTRATLLP